MVAPKRLLQALLDCCSDAPGAAAAAAQADAALSPAQREVRRLLAEAAELEAENPARKTHDHWLASGLHSSKSPSNDRADRRSSWRS